MPAGRAAATEPRWTGRRWLPCRPRAPGFLAGGLSSASLNRALEQCTPNGIDLNSGVEAIPGQKSPQKLLAALKPLISYTPYHIA